MNDINSRNILPQKNSLDAASVKSAIVEDKSLPDWLASLVFIFIGYYELRS